MKCDLLSRKRNEMFDNFSYTTWHVSGICSHSSMTSEITTMKGNLFGDSQILTVVLGATDCCCLFITKLLIHKYFSDKAQH
jgi:hypothetical protein